jgi:hypothetical protein
MNPLTAPKETQNKTTEQNEVQVLPQHYCPKCDHSFGTDKGLAVHLRKGGCIGMWFVCKRCMRAFDTLSAIKAHQDRKRVCQPPIQATSRAATTTELEIPVQRLRLLKGAHDAGNMRTYFDHVAQRAENNELTDCLEATEYSELEWLLEAIEKLKAEPTTSYAFVEVLAQVADFANQSFTSPEKRALIRAFVSRHTTL